MTSQSLLLAALLAVQSGDVLAADPDFVAAVTATHPIAYYRLSATSGASLAGASQYKSIGDVSAAAGPGAPLGSASGPYVRLGGKDGYLLTTQMGGVGSAGSMMAWVNLASLPADEHRIIYVMGESQSGNDFDLQFEPDNVLRFYTAGGTNLAYTPVLSSLVNQWHMLVVTMDLGTKARTIYWDGKPVASDSGGGRATKSSALSMGASTVFGGRYLKGGMQDVALWNRALTAADVATLYAASKVSAGAVAAAPGANAPLPAAPATGPFATTAVVTAEDSSGPIALKREEQIALMFLTSIQNLELNCQLRAKMACTMEQLIAGAKASDGSKIGRLKFDPAIDPNYTYTLATSGTAWEARANPKVPGLVSYYFYAKSIGPVDAHYSRNPTAGALDKEMTSRGVSGDAFDTQ